MSKIKIPNNNINERKYIIDILLREFLGLKYKVTVGSDSDNYEMILENGNQLIIEDHFFSKFSKDLEYLKAENIPKKVEFSKNDFVVEDNIPIIYGVDNVTIEDDSKRKKLRCGIDIFASSFFMLTRWEEYVNKIRDKHNRFPAYASLAYKNNFLDRPIVNEYVEMLWNMLEFLGCKQERKKREFELILTHDVDHIAKWDTPKKFLRHLAGDLIKRKSIKQFIESIFNYIQMKRGIKKDPYDTFDYLMDISESLKTRSYFFIHSSTFSKYDNNNDIYIKQLTERIKERNHLIGYHPSYDSYNDLSIFFKDKEKIESIIGEKLKFGRQHYLRFEVPTTWQIWEDANMKWDSTLSYADKEGFRCGVCYEYSVFNILTQKKLNLKELPLIVMEDTYISYQSQNMEMETFIYNVQGIKNKVKKYQGKFVLLWHNSTLNRKQKEVYFRLIK